MRQGSASEGCDEKDRVCCVRPALVRGQRTGAAGKLRPIDNARNSFRQRTSKNFIASTLPARHGAPAARAPTLTTPAQAAKKEPRREQYSKEKLAEWREAFNIFDSNGDGDIGVQELGNIMKVHSDVVDWPELTPRAATW